MIRSGSAVQTNGRGSRLCSATKRWIASCSATSEGKLPRRSRLRVSLGEPEGVMAPGGALDPLAKEMLYLAASMAAGCAYCTASHTAAARAKGMTEAMRGELLAVVGMAAETNRLADALRVPVDPAFDEG